MSYTRVIPRDLFNEANLLKCLGRVYINLETVNMPGVMLEHETEEHEGFDVWQNESSGATGVSNVILCIGYRRFWMQRPMNSREEWPLYVVDDDENEVPVFNSNGAFSYDFVQFLKKTLQDNQEDD